MAMAEARLQFERHCEETKAKTEAQTEAEAETESLADQESYHNKPVRLSLLRRGLTCSAPACP